MPSNALTTNLVRRHVVLDTLLDDDLDDETLDDTVGGLDGRDHPLAAATVAVAGGGASPSPVGRLRLLLVRQHAVRVLAMTLEEAEVAPRLERLERQVVPAAVEGANRAAAVAAR